MGNYWQVIELLKESKLERSKYIQAFAYFKVNEFVEAEKTLIIDSKNKQEEVPLVVNGAYGMYLLGLVREEMKKK